MFAGNIFNTIARLGGPKLIVRHLLICNYHLPYDIKHFAPLVTRVD